MPPRRKPTDPRQALLAEVARLARRAIAGTISETYRTCGNPGCRCHGPGPKHGPHLYVSYRGESGKTTGYYVPKAAHDEIREGIEAWQALKPLLRDLAELNRQHVLETARSEAQT
jgi:hypothetical protein